MKRTLEILMFATLLMMVAPGVSLGAECKIYQGRTGYDVAGRVDGKKIYRGRTGYDVAYRIDGKKIYRGRTGYDIAGRSNNCSATETAMGALVL